MTAAAGGATEPAPPDAARAVFGRRLALAARYARLLATDGVAHGLLGPREVPRIWDRHLCNCAALGELLPPRGRVVDVGSGAGLPGIALAIRSPGLRVDLVEPLQRRVTFLTRAVAELGLAESVRIVRGRAEEPVVRDTVGSAAWVTARAVAPLGRLGAWCLPLLRPGGSLLAIKGARAAAEVDTETAALRRAGAGDIRIVHCGDALLDPPLTVVQVRRGGERVRRGGKDQHG